MGWYCIHGGTKTSIWRLITEGCKWSTRQSSILYRNICWQGIPCSHAKICSSYKYGSHPITKLLINNRVNHHKKVILQMCIWFYYSSSFFAFIHYITTSHFRFFFCFKLIPNQQRTGESLVYRKKLQKSNIVILDECIQTCKMRKPLLNWYHPGNSSACGRLIRHYLWSHTLYNGDKIENDNTAYVQLINHNKVKSEESRIVLCYARHMSILHNVARHSR